MKFRLYIRIFPSFFPTIFRFFFMDFNFRFKNELHEWNGNVVTGKCLILRELYVYNFREFP